MKGGREGRVVCVVVRTSLMSIPIEWRDASMTACALCSSINIASKDGFFSSVRLSRFCMSSRHFA